MNIFVKHDRDEPEGFIVWDSSKWQPAQPEKEEDTDNEVSGFE